MSNHQETNNVVIAGCGQFGRELANMISNMYSDVVVIDKDIEALKQLSGDFPGFTVAGDASDIDVLRQSGTGRAKTFIAATNQDNVNLFISRIASGIYDVKNVVACVDDPELISVAPDLGIRIICPAQILAKSVLQEINIEVL